MKKLLLPTAIAAVMLFLPIISQADQSGQACKDITLAVMQTHVPIPPASILSRQEVNGVCEVILDINGQYVPVYAGKNFIIAGEMFQDKKQITQTRIDGLKAKNFLRLKPEIEKCTALTFKPNKEIKYTVYMITDPVCPFCHQAESQLKAFAEKNGINYPVVYGDEKVVAAFGGIRGIPTTFIIDRNGSIKTSFVGLRKKEVFEDTIKSMK